MTPTMNRAARRAAKIKPGRPEVGVPAGHGIVDGDLITIAGLRRKPDGSFTKACKPGTETVLVARIAK